VMGWESSVSIVTGYGQDDWGSIAGKGRVLSLFHDVQNRSDTCTATYKVGNADHSTPFSAEVTDTWGYTSTVPCVFTKGCLIGLSTEKICLTSL
jgi:hypothetical protein